MLFFSIAQAIEHSDEELRNTKQGAKVQKDNAETNTTFAKIYVTNTYIKISKEAIITPVEIVYKTPKKERSPSHNKNEKRKPEVLKAPKKPFSVKVSKFKDISFRNNSEDPNFFLSTRNNTGTSVLPTVNTIKFFSVIKRSFRISIVFLLSFLLICSYFGKNFIFSFVQWQNFQRPPPLLL